LPVPSKEEVSSSFFMLFKKHSSVYIYFTVW